MSAITFILFAAGKTLFTAIIILLMAIPSGIGLGIGLHTVKRFIRWWDRKKLPSIAQRIRSYKDFITDEEAVIAGDQT